MSITDWPEAERPREKLLLQGANALSDAELLAIFLRVGCAGKSAVDLARELLINFGGLRPLLESTQEEFCSGLGLGKAKYAQLQAVMEMARRHLSASLQTGDVMSSPDKVRDFLRAKLRHHRREVFAVIFLDTQNQLLTYEEIFFGTLDAASIYPREILMRVFHHNAAAVIFAHLLIGYLLVDKMCNYIELMKYFNKSACQRDTNFISAIFLIDGYRLK